MSGKILSLISKIVSGSFVIVCFIVFIVKTRTIPTSDQAWSIIMVGMFIALIFSPVDLSIIITNIKGLKNETKIGQP